MTKIKICGLTRPVDIGFVNKYKPDYIGFVFAKSKRQISDEKAFELKQNLDKEILAVGVFVNDSIAHIADLVDKNIIDVIQLHGDENKEYIDELKNKVSVPIIKAVRVQTKEQIIKANKLGADNLLLDTYVKDNYGGSGKEFNLNLIPKESNNFFLAGGVTCENVEKMIKDASPYCIDVSSGVETYGFKDEEKIKKIIDIVRKQ